TERLVHDASNNAPSDAELMAALARGEVACLEPLYLRYGDAVFRVVRGVLGHASSAEADDICQSVFLTVLEKAPRYVETGKLRAWLFGVAIRKARSWQRRRWFRADLMKRSLDQVEAPSTDSPEAALELRESLSRILGRLTHGQREVLLLRASEGLRGDEIAAALGISRNAVFTRLHRAQQVLDGILEEEAGR
ncbi:MAG: RNA polymerase sigma factor, partial [Deltaproteobacteria bacterium]|nr:RNA polymerase sigma factor [Deltaproteobacteria bacterium]